MLILKTQYKKPDNIEPWCKVKTENIEPKK